MGFILDTISQFIRDLLQGCILSNLETMFGDVNDKVGTIASEVARTPSTWNASIFGIIQSLSGSVILPIAGAVVSFVLCSELISLVVEKNNFHDLDTGFLFRYLFKAVIAVILLSHTTDIVMGIFDVGSSLVSSAGAVITGNTRIEVQEELMNIFSGSLTSMEIGDLFLLALETNLASLGMKLMAMPITVVLYMRMTEIYLYISVAPLPLSMLMNREWGMVGTNYIRGLAALALQGFFIMVCVRIYSVLVSTITVSANLHSALWQVMAYTVLLCFALFNTASISRSVLHAH